MNLGSISNSTSAVEVKESNDGIWLRDGGWQGLMPYEDFPQFKGNQQGDIAKVEKPESEQYYWPDFGIVADRQTIEDSHSRKRGLQRMRWVALGLLVIMGVVFVISSDYLGQYAWLGYIRAFAEAAMIGALADWFAVTALFRHPLGLPIPHTNIVQNRKNDIGKNLAVFIKNNFLTRQNIEKRLADKDLAGEVGSWLKDKKRNRELSLTLCHALRRVIDNNAGELETFIGRNFREVLDRVNVSRLIARLLNILIIDNRTTVFINKLVDLGQQFFDEHKEDFRDRVKKEAGWGRRKLAGIAFDFASKRIKDALNEIVGDPKIRKEFDERIKQLVWEFEHDSDTKKRAEKYKQKFLNDSEVNRVLSSIGTELKDRLVDNLAETRGSNPPLAENIAKLLNWLGNVLEKDQFVRQMVNERLKVAIPSFIERYRDHLSGGIRKTVENWDARQTSDRIELHIGKDLQFIRINGTIVGGLVGLTIYIISHTFF